ncbi:hypothetical protein MMC29_004399, partial [Sticta canariensis]|nr:hypothetical protein [Sticta canariensis]
MPGENIAIISMSAGWTLDFRGVIFVTPITPEDVNRRPNAMFYVNQSQGLIILGGTVGSTYLREKWRLKLASIPKAFHRWKQSTKGTASA